MSSGMKGEVQAYCTASIDQQSTDGCTYDAYDEEERDDGFGRENGLPCFQTLLAKGSVGGSSGLLLLLARVNAVGGRDVFHHISCRFGYGGRVLSGVGYRRVGTERNEVEV